MRINRYFTDQGYCSRRKADELIAAGRVEINGKKAVLGDQVGEKDLVTVDGQEIKISAPKVYIKYHKPKGITCTTELHIKGNIIDAIKHPLRIFPIGRLDKDSTGLILLTNDGDIVNRILRAEFAHEKEYVVELTHPFDDAFLTKMSEGVNIGDHVTLPCRIQRVNSNTFSIILTEGKNRQIRRMCDVLGFMVRKLHRNRVMNVKINDLKPGQWKDLIPSEIEVLLKSLTSQNSETDKSVHS